MMLFAHALNVTHFPTRHPCEMNQTDNFPASDSFKICDSHMFCTLCLCGIIRNVQYLAVNLCGITSKVQLYTP